MYRAAYGESKQVLTSSAQVLADILPGDLLKLHKPKDWIKLIEKSYNKHSKYDQNDAKTEFLKEHPHMTSAQRWERGCPK